jgi:hypothetical protein
VPGVIGGHSVSEAPPPPHRQSPEPATLLTGLIGLGAGGLACLRRRKG